MNAAWALAAASPFVGAGLAMAARRYGAGRWGVGVVALGCLVVAAAGALAPGGAAWTTAFVWLLLSLSVIDAYVFRLPDPLTLALAALGGAWLWAAAPPELWIAHVLAAAAGMALFLGVNLYYRRFRGMDGLGQGDAKLMGALGLWVGPFGLVTVLMVGSALGLGWRLIAARVQGRAIDMQDAAPFGPFLAAGGLLAWFAGPELAW